MNIENLIVDNQVLRSIDHAREVFAEGRKRKMYVYHTGSLPGDRILNTRLDRLAKFLLIKSELGNCNLFQQRVANSKSFYYICQY